MARARKKLGASAKLIEVREPEASASQSYFAILFAARAALAVKGSFPRTHTGTKGEFGKIFVRPGTLPAELGDFFGEALVYREKSDYGPEFEISERESKDLLSKAEAFVKVIGDWIAGSPESKAWTSKRGG